MKLLTPKSLIDLSDEELADIVAASQHNPWLFLRWLASTFDSHDPTRLSKPFPVKAYLRVICRMWLISQVMFCEKSRQVMMSWTITALMLHDCITQFARMNICQSKKEDDAADLIERARHIYIGLMALEIPWLPAVKMTGDKIGTNDKLEFPSKKSQLRAIPQGGDIVRHLTISRMFADEMNHQPQFADGYDAAQPAIQGGGNYWAMGTPNGRNAAYRLMYGINDETDKPFGAHVVESRKTEPYMKPPDRLSVEEQRYWIDQYLCDMDQEEFDAIPVEQLAATLPGLAYWKTAGDVEIGGNKEVFSIHYSADPNKSRDTERGRKWIKAARASCRTKSKWNREYELDYTSYDGKPIISSFTRTDYVRKLEYRRDLPIEVFVDFGGRCFMGLCQVIKFPEKPYSRIHILSEIFLTGSNTIELADKAKRRIEFNFNSALGFGRIKGFCDPAGNQGKETTADKSWNTSIKIMHQYGFSLNSKMFGVPESCDFLDVVFSKRAEPDADPEELPLVLIDESCTYLIEVCAGGYHYDEKKDGYPDKDKYFEHGGDGLRYYINNKFRPRQVANQKRQQKRRGNRITCSVTGRLLGYRKQLRRTA